MRKEEIKMLEILDEIAEACDTAGAKYYVIEQELLSAYREGPRIYQAEADICILYEDFLKIRKILRKTKYRFIESISNCTTMPGVYFRYVTVNSFLYVQSYHKVRKAHGVAVNIHILRNTGDESKELCKCEKLMETGIEGMPQDKKEELDGMRKIPFLYKSRMKKLLKAAALTDISEKSMLKIPGVKPMSFPAKFWGKQTNITVGNYDFTTTANADKYLTERYGEDYASLKITSPRANYQILVDPEIQYKLVSNKVEAFLSSNPQYWEARDRFTSFYANEYEEMLKHESDDWDVLFFIGDRFEMWKTYDPQREKIRNFLAEGRNDEVFMIFLNYFNLFSSYLKKGRVLYFDEEFWQICSNLWKECGYGELIEEAERLMEENKPVALPEENLRSVFSTNKPKEAVRIRNI